MLMDKGNRGLRRKAAKIIKKLNAAGPPRCLVREFHKPEVDWKVKSYDQLIHGLREEDMTPPPVTLDFTPEEVDVIANDPSKLGLDCLPNHTQSVERRIKDVTGVATAGYCVGVHPHNGNRFEQEMSKLLFSRSIMTSFKSKQDYRSHLTPLVVTYSSS